MLTSVARELRSWAVLGLILAVVTGIMVWSIVAGPRAAGEPVAMTDQPSPTDTIASASASQPMSTATTPSPTASPLASDGVAGDGGCFLAEAGADATPGPRPSGEPAENPGIIDRLPAMAFGEPLDRDALGGAWLLADRFFAGWARGFLACTGADPNDVWIGFAHGSDLGATIVLAYEVDGWSGHQLQDFYLPMLTALMGNQGFVEDLTDGGRHYQRIGVEGYERTTLLFATDTTLYEISEYGVVDYFGESPPPEPSNDEIHLELLRSIPDG